MNVELRHLEAFLAAARHRSFTRAAKSLNISQPTFTVQIRQLEEALGVRLLDRNTRSVQLTQPGRELAPVLERLLKELTTVLAGTKSLSGKAKGHVSVAALPSLCATMLPAIISGFQKGHDGITIDVRDALGVRVAAMVKSGEVDFGFGSVQNSDPDIEFLPLFKDRMHAVFLRGCALERQKSVPLPDVTTFPLILMTRDSTVRAVVDHGLMVIGHFGAPAYEAAYMSTALGMVKAGLGVTILPSSVLDIERRAEFLSRPVIRPSLDRDVGFIQKHGSSQSPAASAFLQAIRRHCKRNGRSGRPTIYRNK